MKATGGSGSYQIETEQGTFRIVKVYLQDKRLGWAIAWPNESYARTARETLTDARSVVAAAVAGATDGNDWASKLVGYVVPGLSA